MISIGQGLRDWKAGDTRTIPFVTLYEIEVDDSTTVRLIAGAPSGELSVTYLGNTYTAAAIEESESESNTEYTLETKKLTISNIDGVAGGYIEQYDLDGRTVTIHRMTLTTLRANP